MDGLRQSFCKWKLSSDQNDGSYTENCQTIETDETTNSSYRIGESSPLDNVYQHEDLNIKNNTLQIRNRRKTRDPTWLQVEVCRDFLRNECKRVQEECRFAHPQSHCQIENGHVITCYDSLKGRCNREVCKYFHPPAHIRHQIQCMGKSYQQNRYLYNYTPNSPEVVDTRNFSMVSPYPVWVPWNVCLSPTMYPTYPNMSPNYDYYTYPEYSSGISYTPYETVFNFEEQLTSKPENGSKESFTVTTEET